MGYQRAKLRGLMGGDGPSLSHKRHTELDQIGVLILQGENFNVMMAIQDAGYYESGIGNFPINRYRRHLVGCPFYSGLGDRPIQDRQQTAFEVVSSAIMVRVQAPRWYWS